MKNRKYKNQKSNSSASGTSIGDLLLMQEQKHDGIIAKQKFIDQDGFETTVKTNQTKTVNAPSKRLVCTFDANDRLAKRLSAKKLAKSILRKANILESSNVSDFEETDVSDIVEIRKLVSQRTDGNQVAEPYDCEIVTESKAYFAPVSTQGTLLLLRGGQQ